MPKDILFNNSYKMLGKSLDVSAKRHSLISSNISNIDTIGFKSKDLDFQKTLEEEMYGSGGLEKTNSKHFDTGLESMMAGKTRENDDEYNLDPVNIDQEMNNLAENNIKFRTSVEMMLRKIGILRHAISEGGR